MLFFRINLVLVRWAALYFTLFGAYSYGDPPNSGVNTDFVDYLRHKYKIPPFPPLPNVPANFPVNVSLRRHNAFAVQFLNDFDVAYRRVLHVGSLLDWDYNTNITVENADRMSEFGIFRVNYLRPWRLLATIFRTDFLPSALARQMGVVQHGPSSVPPEINRELGEIQHSLQSLYNAGKVCVDGKGVKIKRCLKGEPDLSRLMGRSREPGVLRWAWKAWREAVGPPMRGPYFRFVQLQNQLARSGDRSWTNMGEVWRAEFGPNSDAFEAQCEELYRNIRPLYVQLHAFVRRRLAGFYGNDEMFGDDGDELAIPAHLLGNMWAQDWEQLIDIARPFPNRPVLDATDEMERQRFTPITMFEIAEEFFVSLGMDRMTEEFWRNSMLSKPTDRREVACHGSATNFFDGRDFRIRMCSEVTMEDLNTAHHEMGHVEYFMQYRHQPILFQDGANSAFHEAVGDTIQYSFLSPGHLHRVGLLPHPGEHPEDDLNFLMRQALMKLPLIPFSLVMDKWRWELFAGSINDTNANQRWWQLRRKYQGIKPPIPRTEHDFDPGAKYHVPDNTPYIRYFISSFIQVQFHRALCLESLGGQAMVPLHRCSIYGSKRAGSLLKSVLELGSSIPWREAMTMLTGQPRISADALLEYYEPLYRWLLRENLESGEYYGW